MYQIDNSTAAVAQPASTPAGTAGFFTDGNPAGGTAATIVPAEWLNAVMMELVNVVIAGGLTPTKNVFDQVAKAIKAIGKQRVILNDTGAANAYTAVNSPALVGGAWVDGIAQSVKIANANTGPSTYSPDGLAAIPIFGLGLQPLQGGELRAGGVATMVRFTIVGVNSGNPICVLLDCFGGAQQIGPATASQHAMQLGQAVGRLLRVSVYSIVSGVQQISVDGGAFTTTGATIFTPRSDTTSIVVEQCGAGGGSGATTATGATAVSVTGGGGVGSYARDRYSSGFAGASVTVGVGGAAGVAPGGNGGAGGTSSFGSLRSTIGGFGSIGVGAIAPPYFANGGGGGAYPAGGNVFRGRGADGTTAQTVNTTNFISGTGGNSVFGAGGTALSATGPGNAGQSPGSGAGGAATGISAGAQAGAKGADGVVIVYEYA